MRDVRSSIANVAVHLAHDTDVLVAVEERVLFLAVGTKPARTAAVRGLVRLKAGIGEDDNESLGVFVRVCDGDVLLGHQLWEGRRREGLCAWHFGAKGQRTEMPMRRRR